MNYAVLEQIVSVDTGLAWKFCDSVTWSGLKSKKKNTKVFLKFIDKYLD